MKAVKEICRIFGCKEEGTHDYYQVPYCVYHYQQLMDGKMAVAKPIKKENVNHPSHYNQGGIECIDALEAATNGLEGIEAFDTANAIKYLWRWKQKNGNVDLKKAIWYIEHLLKHLEKDPSQ